MDLGPLHDLKDVLPESTLEALLNPAAKSIGTAVGGLSDFIFYPLHKLGIYTEQKLKEYSDKIKQKTNDIPIENRDASKLNLVFKALEDSKYQVNEEELQEAFANLIASTIDNRVNKFITPRFSTALAELGSEDAQLINIIAKQPNFQMVCGDLIVMYKKDGSSKPISDLWMSTTDSAVFSMPDSVDTLDALKIISVTRNEWFLADAYQTNYKIMENALKAKYHMSNLKENEEVQLRKGCLRTTTFGKHFISCVTGNTMK